MEWLDYWSNVLKDMNLLTWANSEIKKKLLTNKNRMSNSNLKLKTIFSKINRLKESHETVMKSN